MTELHPFFVHFPIALLTVAVFFDFFGAWKNTSASIKTAFILQAIAATSALFAAISGNSAEALVIGQQALAQGVSDALSAHVTMGNASVWIMIAVVVGRSFTMLEQKSWAPKVWIFAFLSLALAGLVLTTGLLGGRLSHEMLQFFMEH